MSIALNQILSLVRNLNDSIRDNTSRQRFRNFLRENITEVDQIRDYMEECLRNKGI